MTERKTPIEQALDLFFFAPLGLLMNAEEVVPQLVERGRQQVTMARMFGQFAVKQGQTEAEKAFSRLQNLAESYARPDGTSEPVSDNHVPATQTSAPVARPQHNGEMAAQLAIPDYDSLSASQVVPRLESLSGGELDAVREYETANRGRKTILSKIDQVHASQEDERQG
ncbi:MAG TPA: hypothetical protein VGJ03_17665 [Acidimicrobiales bacterium]